MVTMVQVAQVDQVVTVDQAEQVVQVDQAEQVVQVDQAEQVVQEALQTGLLILVEVLLMVQTALLLLNLQETLLHGTARFTPLKVM
jgi:hypothetical protein